MKDADCVGFLQWALPRMGMRWPGFRRVRRQVCRRIAARLAELELEDLEAYRATLEDDGPEWRHLERLCRVTISRFYRDRRLWEVLAFDTLPGLCRELLEAGHRPLRVWSAGCGSGEEPYTAALLRRFALPEPLRELPWEILATDVDRHLLLRAEAGVYPASSLRELPKSWRDMAFRREEEGWRLDRQTRESVCFELQDLRRQSLPGRFHLIFCRNLAFTYFDERVQRAVLDRLLEVLAPGGCIAVGAHERLPVEVPELRAEEGLPSLYRRRV